jgi:Zn-dependent peptidase ImmA (M78 family)
MEAVKGVPEGLRYLLRWSASRASGTAAEATRGALYVEIMGRPVWGDRTVARRIGIPWTWVDLLEHLARNWASLVWEEADPLDLRVPPQELRTEAERRWKRLPTTAIEPEERTLLRFQRAHDLAMALGGASAPSLWLMREGARFMLAGDRFLTYRPFPEVKSTLEAIGSEIASRLSLVPDERAAQARAAWSQREQIASETLVSLATGLSRERLASLQAGQDTTSYWEVPFKEPQPTPVLAAARMLGPLAPDPVMKACLDWIRSCRRRPTSDLDALSSEAIHSARALNIRQPFAQGYKLAGWLRAIPGISTAEGRVDPDNLLASLGVEVSEADLGWPEIDAVACWSSDHGPAVRYNSVGRHAQGESGRRTTLAHELCHLLVDRGAAMPLAEVLGGRTPIIPEKRANAFAAELLLPRIVAGQTFTNGSNVETQTEQLKAKYGVSAEVVAWQALRSEYPLRKVALAKLRQYVRETAAWDAALRHKR